MSHNILLVSHSDFPANSAVHVHHFANELVKLGCDCVVAVPYNQNSVAEMSNYLYAVIDFQRIEQLPSKFKNGLPPQVVHCWTPREHVRKLCCRLSLAYDFSLIVHLEDNEEAVTRRFIGISKEDFDHNGEKLLPHNLSHPHKYKQFLDAADGTTIIIEQLKDFLAPPQPYLTLFPGVDPLEFYPRPADIPLKQQLNISPECTVICYTGNVHLANQGEVRELYLAIGARNKAGRKTILVRTGIDNNLNFLDENDLWVKEYVREMGWVKREQIPSILSIADILVQPGGPDEFNDYRFPSKIPEFLAMGKPVLLPNTNIARHLTHLVDAFILPAVNCDSLVTAIDFLMDNPEICTNIVKGGIEYARTHLDWSKNTKQLLDFYGSIAVDAAEPDRQEKRSQRLKLLIADYVQESGLETERWTQKLDDALGQIERQQNQINELTAAKQNLEGEISAMASSKFWKLRQLWFGIKEKIC